MTFDENPNPLNSYSCKAQHGLKKSLMGNFYFNKNEKPNPEKINQCARLELFRHANPVIGKAVRTKQDIAKEKSESPARANENGKNEK
ncbi:hypothetical protein PRIPAC_85819 [Pristionchus pacificus]|uniref:Uncharacterized protein n=1 Tax=Pristionchus pacificus TaxID=54126 RepID=A0A2A6BM31_PRIPA|nr:hypothetical protein PRIPAC_85819 [Pristionchus pacificus]|eukprot:PDM66984.1 hypothetical protein PRIPAC_48401 [Pristionchus pacificus]